MTGQQPTLETEILERWIGNAQSTTDTIDARPARFLGATIGHGDKAFEEGSPLPPAYHWLYFLEAPAMDTLGRDGHAALGDFLPPVALPRRMWAGTRIRFHRDIRIGESLEKRSVVQSVARKSGRSGELCFVTVKHELLGNDDIRLEEEHDIVYREEATSSSAIIPPEAPGEHDMSRTIDPTPTLLFRYSALTFNGHRIHYDVDYCRDVEHYPGLVVHAPLTATLMLDLACRYREQTGVSVSFTEFHQKSVSPLYHLAPYTVNLKDQGETWEIWAANPEGRLAATAQLSVTR